MKITYTFDDEQYKIVPIEPTTEMVNSTYAGMMECQSVDLQIKSRKVMRDRIALAIAAAPPYPADTGWISVDDRLPEANITVLVVTNFDCIYTCRLPVIVSKNSALDLEHGIRERFTHWMPLPPAPKGE